MTTRHSLLAGLFLSAGAVSAQTGSIYAGEAFRFSEIQQTGTARFRGIGGNQAALGGDASNLFGNPAGLAFYNRSELSISPSVNILSNNATYLGNNSTSNGTKFSLGQLGLIFAGGDNNGSRWRRTTFGVGYNQNINYVNNFSFQGRNNRSSFVDPILLDANSRKIDGTPLLGSDINEAYKQTAPQAPDLLAAAYQLFLVNGVPITNSQGQEDSTVPFTQFEPNLPRDQRNVFSSTGSQSQWTFAYAGNLDDKLYLGANLGLATVRYNTDNVLTETVIGGRVFDTNAQRDRLTVKGNGFNLKIGAIYKLTPDIQIGATVATPTWMSVRETFNQSVSVVPRDPNLASQLIANSVEVQPNDFNYRITTPFRASGGATVFLGQGKIGFLTASAEYVGYGGISASSTDDAGLKNDVRTTVQSTYQNVVNVRGGAEVRAGLFRVRAGVAYLPDPYVQKLDNIDRSRLLLSGGVGVRNERFFADVSGTYNTFKSAFTPYTLPNTADYGSAQLTNNSTNVTLSVGTFF